MRIGFVGLGKLGLCVSVAIAERGHTVFAYDIQEELCEEIAKGNTNVYEPNIQEKLKTVLNSGNYIVSDLEMLVGYSDIIFIAVQTPTNPDGSFDTSYVKTAITSILKEVKQRDSFKVISVISTVLPGTMRREFYALTKEFQNVELCYNASFIAMGTVIQDFIDPEFILIGEYVSVFFNDRAGEYLEVFYRTIVPKDTPILRMTWENAEIVKMIYNTFIGFKIVTANVIGELCDKIPYTNSDVVVQTIALANRRIVAGSYLKAGMGDGGPCVKGSTLVQTDRGLKRIDEIKVGENVLSHDGKFHNVKETFIRDYDGDLVELTPEGFSKFSIIATPTHPVYSAKRTFHGTKRYIPVINNGYDGYSRQVLRLSPMIDHSILSFTPIEQLEVGDLLVLPQIKETNPEIPSIALRPRWNRGLPTIIQLTPEILYFFGLYLAEGYTWEKAIYLSLHKNETIFVDEVNQITEKYFGVPTKIHHQKGNGILTRMFHTSLAEYLRQTFGESVYTKHIPYKWLQLPEDCLIALIRGLWYGDGSKTNNQHWFQSSSRDLFEFSKLALLKLGIAFRTKVYGERFTGKERQRHNPSYWIGTYDIEKMNKVLPMMELDPRRVVRKIWFEDGCMLYHVKQKKRYHFEGKVYNLEVENMHSYVLEGGVVHNCHPRDQEALSWLAKKLKLSSNPFKFIMDARYKQTEYIANRAITLSKHYRLPIVILGARFKPETNLTDYSPSLLLSEILKEKGIEHKIYEVGGVLAPMGPEKPAIFITTLRGVFKDSNFPKGSVILDMWRDVKPREGILVKRFGASDT